MIILILLNAVQAWAQTPATQAGIAKPVAVSRPAVVGKPAAAAVAPPAKPAAKSGTLDFEADVIEGERARPDVFVQLGTGAQNMNSALYSRENFNDFQAQDRLQRPGYIEAGGKK